MFFLGRFHLCQLCRFYGVHQADFSDHADDQRPDLELDSILGCLHVLLLLIRGTGNDPFQGYHQTRQVESSPYKTIIFPYH